MQSQWSIPDAAGQPVNYHGLGLRFVRSFGGMRTSSTLSVDGQEMEFPDGLGVVPHSVTLIGSFDGAWPPPRAGVTIEQDQRNALFSLRDPFAYLALGPSKRCGDAGQRRTDDRGNLPDRGLRRAGCPHLTRNAARDLAKQFNKEEDKE